MCGIYRVKIYTFVAQILNLPEIPVTRVVNGHNVFNKGYHHGLRGKTYEE